MTKNDILIASRNQQIQIYQLSHFTGLFSLDKITHALFMIWLDELRYCCGSMASRRLNLLSYFEQLVLKKENFVWCKCRSCTSDCKSQS